MSGLIFIKGMSAAEKKKLEEIVARDGLDPTRQKLAFLWSQFEATRNLK